MTEKEKAEIRKSKHTITNPCRARWKRMNTIRVKWTMDVFMRVWNKQLEKHPSGLDGFMQCMGILYCG